MIESKHMIGIALAAIMIASIFAALPGAVVAQGAPPGPPGDDNQPMNPLNYGSSLRVYGEDNKGPLEGYFLGQGRMIYDNWSDPFDPTALQKDSVTCNPAIIIDGTHGGYFGGMSATSTAGTTQNLNVKKYLRFWYEPDHYYSCSSYHHATIEVETTYLFLNADDDQWTPMPIKVPSQFVFPIAEDVNDTQRGLSRFSNAQGAPLDGNKNMTHLTNVSSGAIANYSKTTNGTIELQKGYTLAPGQTVQFLDHKLTFEYLSQRGNDVYAVVTMWYAGNVQDDTPVTTTLGRFADGTNNQYQRTYFDRHNVKYTGVKHLDRTWFAQYYAQAGNGAQIYVGKELSAGDTFYVDAVRYDVPAVTVLDSNSDQVADALVYITLRTPLPKDLNHPDTLFPDDCIVSSQWIDAIAINETIPLNPPFNAFYGGYDMVDDINVVLWNNGSDIIDTAEEERYLTSPNAPVGWTKIDKDADGNWIADDPNDERLLMKEPPLLFCYIEETDEPRYTVDLEERLMESLQVTGDGGIYGPNEYWGDTQVRTLPNLYTAFALPERRDVTTSPIKKYGDYLLTSSFLAPNAQNSTLENATVGIPRMAFAFDPMEKDSILTDIAPGMDIYVNNFGDYAARVRIYGEDDLGPIDGYDPADGTYNYSNYTYPFNPAALRKDSITFNPAIVDWSQAYPMSFDGLNGAVKKFLRIWYEPEHHFCSQTKPTIEVETTYMLVKASDIDPYLTPVGGSQGSTFMVFPIASDQSTSQRGLELFENPAGWPDRKNLTTLAYVNGTVTPQWKTVNQSTIRLEKSYRLNIYDQVNDTGETVQFLDMELRFYGRSEHNGTAYASVGIRSVRNGFSAAFATLTLGQFGAVYGDPHQTTFVTAETPTTQETSDHTNGNVATWYARLEELDPVLNSQWAKITVGKEIEPDDTFYVDQVRYDVGAIETFDTNGDNYSDKFKYITIKTPLPKCVATGGNPIADDCIISSTLVDCVDFNEPLPLNPPFNMQHDIVDDLVCPSYDVPAAERIIGPYAPLNVSYIWEVEEPRYSTNLLEVLWENETGVSVPLEGWTKFDVRTMPDQYTEFVLPADAARWNSTSNTWLGQWSNKHNDYLITTSFFAPNAVNSELTDLTNTQYNRTAFVFDAIHTQGIYINEITSTGLNPPPQTIPVVNITVTPDPTNVTGCQDVVVCTDGTTDDQWPLTVWVDWGDGEVSPQQPMDQGGSVCFTHAYRMNGTKTLTVYARDGSGAVGNKTHQVNVTSDCCIFTLSPGWNQFSACVNSTDNVSTIFGPYMGSWFTTVWTWDETIPQGWDTLGGSDTLDPTRGYFVYCPVSGPVIKIEGTAAPYDASRFTPTPGGPNWYMVGAGYWPHTEAYYGYWWNPSFYTYSPTTYFTPSRGYWVKGT
jgi:hypothetical protein